VALGTLGGKLIGSAAGWAGNKLLGSSGVQAGSTAILNQADDIAYRGIFQSLTRTVEHVAGFRLFGNKGLVGSSFQRNVFLIEAELKGAAPLRKLIDKLETEALEAGATELRITGFRVSNKGVFSKEVAKRFGFEFRRINERTVELWKVFE
jgi:hypothetical protein